MVLELVKKGWNIKISFTLGKWWVEFRHSNGDRYFLEQGDDVSHAICLAYLKVKKAIKYGGY